MSYTSLNPKFDSTTLKDQGANSVSSPAASSHKIIDRNGILYLKNSAGIEVPIGTAGSGTKNYLSALITSLGSGAANPGNGDFETGGVTGWSLAHSALTSLVPTSVASAGTTFSSAAGGTAANGNLSFASISSNQLGGRYCASLASSSASTAGDLLVSDAFFIDLEDQAKMLNFSFAYKAVTGTFDMSGTSTNTFAVYIYDITNGAWIQPAGVYNIVQSSGVGKCQGSFQTTSNGTKYQIALVNINATSGAYALYVDDFQMGPLTIPSAPAMETEYDVGALVIPNSGKFGTVVNTKIWGRRVGNMFECRGQFTSGTLAGGDPYLTLSGLTIDTNKIYTTVARDSVGEAWVLDNSGANFGSDNRLGAMYIDPTQLNRVYFCASVASNVFRPTIAGGSGSAYAFKFSIPIAGWDSNSVMSADTDTRVVAASYYMSTNQTSDTSTPGNYDTKIYDTHAAVTTGASWKFTAPVSGFYRISGKVDNSGTPTYSWSIYKNGTVFKRVTTVLSGNNETFSSTIQLNAGDYFDMRASSSQTMSGGSLTAANVCVLDIDRLCGPAVIAASEKVACQYGLTSAVNPGATSVLKYDTKLKDSHGAYSTSTGLFTVPITGTYKVAAVSEAGAAVTVYVVKNGSGVVYLSTTGGSGAAASGAADVDCIAGDTLAIYSVQSATYGAITGGIYQNYLSISKV